MEENILLKKQLLHIASQLSVSSIFSFIAVFTIAFFIYDESNSQAVLLWASIAVVITCFRVYLLVAVKRSLFASDIKKSKLLVLLNALLSGITWGLGVLLVLTHLTGIKLILFTTALATLSCSAIPVYSAYIPAYVFYVAAAIFPASYQLFKMDMQDFSVLSILFLAFMLLSSRSSYKTTLRSISLDLKNAMLLEKVTEEKAKADHANVSKSQFLAAASHDLRQPLHSMGVFLDILSIQLQQTSYEKILGHINSSHHALTDLFNSLLEVSRLDSGSMPCKMIDCDIKEVISPIIIEFEKDIHDKGLKFNVDVSSHAVKTDVILFGRIVRNLLSNAIKFTQLGEISVSAKLLDDGLLFSITDTGMGISQEQQARIFDEYYQINNHARDRSKGVGLGLSVVKKISDLLNCDISIASEVGKGSQFILKIPLGDADNIVKKQYVKLLSDAKELFTGLNILVVDNEPEILLAMNMLLTDWNVNVMPAIGVNEALEQLRHAEFNIDLIISDYRLDNDDTGLVLIERVRKQFDCEVPAVLITGDTDPILREKIENEGYFVLQKPVNAGQLKRVMLDLLDKN